MKKKYLSLSVASLVLFGSALVASANVPPPSVNQNIGIPDSVFNNLAEKDCRGCHDGTGTNGTKAAYLPDRHHLKVGTVMGAISDAPYSDMGGAVSGQGATYVCLSCHSLVPDAQGNLVFKPFRDCMLCHIQNADATVHHRSQKALLKQCTACHGNIDSLFDNHFIPTYAKSLVTPETGEGKSPVTNAAGKHQGGCAFCHNAGTDTAKGTIVFPNKDTHHSTGLAGSDFTGSMMAPACQLCHDTTAENIPGGPNANVSPYPYAIRKCEACHGVNSLHNIAYNSNGDGVITPGKENPWYSHVGAQQDCMGCHGGFQSAFDASQSVSNVLIPFVNALSTQSLQEGVNSAVTAMGGAMVNSYTDGTGTTRTVAGLMKLTNNITGQEIIMAPAGVTEATLTASVPAYLPEGSYKMQIVKETQTSNASNITISPKMDITKARCFTTVEGGFVALRIMGSGFGGYFAGMSASNSGYTVNDGACVVNTWSDTLVEASCGKVAAGASCPDQVTVGNLFTSASAPVGDATGACIKCHSGKVALTCNVVSSHARRGYLDAATAKTEAAKAGLTCTTTTTTTKNRARK